MYLKNKKSHPSVLKGVHSLNFESETLIFNPYNKSDSQCVWSAGESVPGVISFKDCKKQLMNCQQNGDIAKYTLCSWLRINSMGNNTTTPLVKHIMHIGDLVNVGTETTGDITTCQPGVWLDTWTNRLIIRFYTLGREKKMLRMIPVSQSDFDKNINFTSNNNCYNDGHKGTNRTFQLNNYTGKGIDNDCFQKYTSIPLDTRTNMPLRCSNLCENNKFCTMSHIDSDNNCQIYTMSSDKKCSNMGPFNTELYLDRQKGVEDCENMGEFKNDIFKKINIMDIQAVEDEVTRGKMGSITEGGHSENIGKGGILGSLDHPGSHGQEGVYGHSDTINSCKYMNQWPTTPHNGYMTSVRYHDNKGWLPPFNSGVLEDWWKGSTKTEPHNNYLSMSPYYNYNILTCQDEGIDVENVPVRRWFHLAITTQGGLSSTGGVSEVYINGKIVKSKVYQKTSPPIYSNPPSLVRASLNPIGFTSTSTTSSGATRTTTSAGGFSGAQVGTTGTTTTINTLTAPYEYYGCRNLFIGLNSAIDTTNYIGYYQTKSNRSGNGQGASFNGQIADVYYFCKILTPKELSKLYESGPILTGWNRFLNKLKNMKGWIAIGIQVGDGPMHSHVFGGSELAKNYKTKPPPNTPQA